MTIPTTENIKLWFNPGFVRDKMLALRAEIDRLTAELVEAHKATDARLQDLLQWVQARDWVSKPALMGKIASLFIDPNNSTAAKATEPKPAPDDTRELVAQGLEILARACNLQDMPKTAKLTEPIIAKLRGGA